MKKYNTIVIDPPWPIHLAGKFRRRPNLAQKLPYTTMTIEEIKRFPLNKFANEGAHIYLWTTNRFIKEAIEIIEHWNLKYHMTLVMCKPSGVCPIGYVFGTEFCILGYKGKLQRFKKKGILNWFKGFNKAGLHSSKPDEFYKIVETMSPGPYIDIFSRKNRHNWDAYGNEIGKFN